MTGKNSCQTIRHHPARVPSSSSFVSLLPRASAPSLPPLRVDTFESWNSPYKRKIDESFLSERRSYPRMRRAGEEFPEEYSRKSCTIFKIQSFFLLIRSRKSLFYFEILFSENFIRNARLEKNARIEEDEEEGMIRWRKEKKRKRKKGSRAALLIELAKD